MSTELQGRSLIAGEFAQAGGAGFTGFNPMDGLALEPAYVSASTTNVDSAVASASAAFDIFANTSGEDRAAFLSAIADGLDAAAPELIARANLETALPIPRLTGEVARTSGQMRHFATVLEEGSWVSARIETADPARTPPKPDLRSMLRPLGPVVVFGASNFPLAFSVAGGDTASALAAGNPVIVKAHPAHPGTSELAGSVIREAVKKSGLPGGVFSLLFDAGHEIGAALVQHPDVKAVGFTGSWWTSADGSCGEACCASPCLCGDGKHQPGLCIAGRDRRTERGAGQGTAWILHSGRWPVLHQAGPRIRRAGSSFYSDVAR
jgi:alpha-ketoglutaric semialdehyde dehydrogenase